MILHLIRLIGKSLRELSPYLEIFDSHLRGRSLQIIIKGALIMYLWEVTELLILFIHPERVIMNREMRLIFSVWSLLPREKKERIAK